MTTKRESSLMGGRTRFFPCIGLLFFLIILARVAWAKCSDKTFDSTCLCIDDSQCGISFYGAGDCRCLNGQDVTLEQLVQHLIRTDGVVEYLYISGSDMYSIEPLDGHLKEIRYDLVVEQTALRNVSGLDCIQMIGNLWIENNPALSDVDGLGNVTQVSGDLWIENNIALSDVDGLGNVTQVSGNLWIENNPALSDVDGLGSVTQVSGDLRIRNNLALSDVNGLGNVTLVGGDLMIWKNSALSDVDGLGNATQVGGNLMIWNNSALSDVNGLGNVTQVGGDLVIWNNYALSDVNGLSNVTRVDGGLRIQNNPALSEVDGLGNVTQVGGDLTIRGNSALSGVGGLGNVTQVGGGLWIAANPALSDVNGMGNVTQVGGDLVIWNNSVLSDVNGLSNVTRVDGALRIEYNPALSEVDGLGNVTLVGGDLTIRGNSVLSDVNGLGSITQVGGGLVNLNDSARFDVNGLGNVEQVGEDLQTGDGPALSDVNGLGNATQVGGNLWISDNSALSNVNGLENIRLTYGDVQISNNMALSDLSGLGNINRVMGDVTLSFLQGIRSRGGHLLESLVDVEGKLTVKNCDFDTVVNLESPGYVLMPNLTNVWGSFLIERSTGLSLSLEKLQNVCVNAVNKCSFAIQDNSFQRTSLYGSLNGTLRGSLSIMRNQNLHSINFKNLISLRGDQGIGEDRFVGGLTISFNPNLTTVDGFDALETIAGDLEIVGNEFLNYINLKALFRVDGTTRITPSANRIPSFVSNKALPYRADGCRKWRNVFPGSFALVTKLVREECKFERLTPILVGFAIIGMLFIISLLLLYYLALTICSPYKEMMSLADVRDMFASHLLALADVLSDVGFAVTAFILWDIKRRKEIEGGARVSEGSHTELLAIGIASAVVVVISQVFAISAVYGLLVTTRVVHDGTTRRLSLMDYLKEGKKMQKYDWLVLFPGLLLLDVEIIKHLPWGADLKVDGKKMVDNDGMPHKYFTWVAYIAVMLEDLPQVVLQVAFVVVIEEDDGWAITAAMASLTLSMADVLVKLVFPPFIKRLTKHSRSCLRRVNAMDRTGLCGQLCPQHSMAERGETSEDVEHPENQ